MINNTNQGGSQNYNRFHELKYKILKVYMEVMQQHSIVSYEESFNIKKLRDWTPPSTNRDNKMVLQLVQKKEKRERLRRENGPSRNT